MLSNYSSVARNTVLTVFPDDSRSRCRIIMIHGIKYGLVEELWKSKAGDRSEESRIPGVEEITNNEIQ